MLYIFHAIFLRLLNHPANLVSLGMDTDLDTLLAFFSAAAASLLSANKTAGVVSVSEWSALRDADLMVRLVEEALLLLSMTGLRTGGGPLVGGGGGAVGGLGGLLELVLGAGAGGIFPGSTVTRVAGFAYKFPLS